MIGSNLQSNSLPRSAPGAENPLDQPLTIYIKFDRPTQNTRYNFQVTYNP